MVWGAKSVIGRPVQILRLCELDVQRSSWWRVALVVCDLSLVNGRLFGL